MYHRARLGHVTIQVSYVPQVRQIRISAQLLHVILAQWQDSSSQLAATDHVLTQFLPVLPVLLTPIILRRQLVSLARTDWEATTSLCKASAIVFRITMRALLVLLIRTQISPLLARIARPPVTTYPRKAIARARHQFSLVMPGIRMWITILRRSACLAPLPAILFHLVPLESVIHLLLFVQQEALMMIRTLTHHV